MAERLRCESGEWKTRNHFSKRQLDKYDQQARNGRATAAKTGIRCLEHSSGQNHELKCNGPCDRWRELRFFSKSTRRNGKNWCIDCIDWQVRTENGETLPPPGALLSVEEFVPGPLQPAQPGDDMASGHDSGSFNDAASSFAGIDDGISDSISTLALSEQQSTNPESFIDGEKTASDSRLDSLMAPRLGRIRDKAPHWLIPDLGGPPLGTLRSTTTSAFTSTDGASVTSSEMTAFTRGPRGQPVTYNAWGPNGEYARRVKNPTVTSGSTPSETTRSSQPVQELGRKGWAKAPTRKQPPQLPNYLKYDPPAADDGDDDVGSNPDDGSVWR